MKRTEIKRTPLDDVVLEGLEPEENEYCVKDSLSLYFRVTPTGGKSWKFRYKKEDGKWSWISLGQYPIVTGAKARRKARDLLNDIEDGKPIVVTKKQIIQKALLDETELFKYIADEWLELKKRNWVEGTYIRNKGALHKHIYPKFGHRPFREIDSAEWFKHLKDIQDKQGILEQVNRMFTMCRSIYNYAIAMGKTQYNPVVSGLTEYLTKPTSKSMPHVETEEVPELIRAIKTCPSEQTRIGLQLLSYLFCRPSELREAKWTEFNIEMQLWSVPAERMKKRREHLVPLPHQVCVLLTRLREINSSSEYLFPSRSDINAPSSETVFIMALRRLGYHKRHTPHGFRHVASTILNELGYDERHVEFSLAHVKGGVSGKYNKAKYLADRIVLMQDYANYLDKISS